MPKVPQEAKRDINPLELEFGVAVSCCWESNTGPLQDQHVLLNVEPPVQPPCPLCLLVTYI